MRPSVHQQHELAEREQDAEAHLADGRRNRGHDADRREHHDVAGELEHHLRGALEHVRDRAALLAHRRQADAEEDREDHDLQDVAARHRIDDRRRDQRDQHVPSRMRLDALHGLQRVGGHRRRLDAGARLEHVDDAKPEKQRDRGRDLEIDDGLEADAAHRLQVAGARDADDQRRKQQRRDDHLDHPQERVGDRLDLLAEAGGVHAVRVRRRPQVADQRCRGAVR